MLWAHCVLPLKWSALKWWSSAKFDMSCGQSAAPRLPRSFSRCLSSIQTYWFRVPKLQSQTHHSVVPHAMEWHWTLKAVQSKDFFIFSQWYARQTFAALRYTFQLFWSAVVYSFGDVFRLPWYTNLAPRRNKWSQGFCYRSTATGRAVPRVRRIPKNI